MSFFVKCGNRTRLLRQYHLAAPRLLEGFRHRTREWRTRLRRVLARGKTAFFRLDSQVLTV